jgi:hypothetical protein
MKILILVLVLLVAAPGLASEPSEAVLLAADIPYTPKEEGAFLPKPRAELIKTAFERERQKAELCLQQLENNPSPYGTAVVVSSIAFVIGISIGLAIKK